MKKSPLTVAFAGLGTVGCGAINILIRHQHLIESRLGRSIKIGAVSARDKHKNRGVDLSSFEWVDHPLSLINIPSDVIVETIGGSEGVAFDLAQACLKSGRHFVTSNKALVATHGKTLSDIARKNKVGFAFDGAVVGGVPVIPALTHGLMGNQIHKIEGLLNGTSNFILSLMEQEEIPYDEALKCAQEKGYAEADPSSDVEGLDATHKLSILNALCYNTFPDISLIRRQGISNLTLQDVQRAKAQGKRYKQLAQTLYTSGVIQSSVTLQQLNSDHLLFSVTGVQNACVFSGDSCGEIFLKGPGAGAEATGSAVVSDLIDIARGMITPGFGLTYA